MAILTDANLKLHLGIDADDSIDDDTITVAVNAANEAIVTACNRNFDTATTGTRVYYPVHSHLVRIDDCTSVTTVKTDTSDDGTFDTTWDTADYQVEPLNGLVDGRTVPYYKIRSVEAKTFPVLGHRPSVQVTAVFGWASVPDPVTLAARIMGARLWRRKDSPEASFGFGEFALRLARTDPDVVPLLQPYVRSWSDGVAVRHPGRPENELGDDPRATRLRHRPGQGFAAVRSYPAGLARYQP